MWTSRSISFRNKHCEWYFQTVKIYLKIDVWVCLEYFVFLKIKKPLLATLWEERQWNIVFVTTGKILRKMERRRQREKIFDSLWPQQKKYHHVYSFILLEIMRSRDVRLSTAAGNALDDGDEFPVWKLKNVLTKNIICKRYFKTLNNSWF